MIPKQPARVNLETIPTYPEPAEGREKPETPSK